MPCSYKIMDAKLFTMEVCPEKTCTHLHNEMEQIRATGSLPISSFCMIYSRGRYATLPAKHALKRAA